VGLSEVRHADKRLESKETRRSVKTIPSYVGLPLSDLASVGLAGKMRPAHDLIAEQQRLSAKQAELGREMQDLRERIKDTAEALVDVVIEHREEWDALVRSRGEKILQEAQQMAHALSAKLGETDGYVALHGWLEFGTRSWSPPMPAAVSIDTLVHERARDLGLLDVEVLR
jgi:hypothetical protein